MRALEHTKLLDKISRGNIVDIGARFNYNLFHSILCIIILEVACCLINYIYNYLKMNLNSYSLFTVGIYFICNINPIPAGEGTSCIFFYIV